MQRLCDKNHAWDLTGLGSLIPNGAAQGLSGYAFGCPDMIGGGQYSDFYHLGTLEPRFDIDQELFVRFAQVVGMCVCVCVGRRRGGLSGGGHTLLFHRCLH